MTHTEQDKQKALKEIAAIAQRNNLTGADITTYLDGTSTTDTTTGRRGQSLPLMLAYLGGICILAGISAFIGMQWAALLGLQRVIITLGTGIVCFILGVLAAKDSRFTHAIAPLFLIAAVLETSGLFVVLHEYGRANAGGMGPYAAIFAIMLCQQLVTFYALGGSVLIFISLFFWAAFLGTIFTMLDFAPGLNAFVTGVSLLLMAYSIATRGYQRIGAFWYCLAGLYILGGSFAFLENTWLEIAYPVINLILIYLSLRCYSRSLLTISVLGLLAYLGYVTDHYFANIVGWPIALIVMGLVMIGISSYAYKLGRTIRTDTGATGTV